MHEVSQNTNKSFYTKLYCFLFYIQHNSASIELLKMNTIFHEKEKENQLAFSLPHRSTHKKKASHFSLLYKIALDITNYDMDHQCFENVVYYITSVVFSANRFMDTVNFNHFRHRDNFTKFFFLWNCHISSCKDCAFSWKISLSAALTEDQVICSRFPD